MLYDVVYATIAALGYYIVIVVSATFGFLFGFFLVTLLKIGGKDVPENRRPAIPPKKG